MAEQKVYLAVDLGASSGRVMAALFDGEKITLEEVNRFHNGPVEVDGSYYWEIERLFEDVKTGIKKGCETYGDAVVSIGVDTWGVDYGLFDKYGEMINPPFAYRDKRTDGMEEEAARLVPRKDIYQATGIQFIFLNSLNQLLSEVVAERPELDRATDLLFIPDMFNYWLTGKMANERTFASTSQMLDPHTGDWAYEMLEKMNIPTSILGEVIEPGTNLGELTLDMKEDLGTGSAEVIAVGSHDTASAVAAVPVEVEPYAYLSSGTWSLMGIESAEPIITEKSYEYSFTNEGGVCNTIRVLKNICGLWLQQECKRNWDEQGDVLKYEEIVAMAAEAPPFSAQIDPDWEGFKQPCNMPAQIQAFCEQTGQTRVDTKPKIARTVLESLALRYRSVLEMLEDMAGHRLKVLHVVGGGSQNVLLNQFTANAIGRPVIAGPVEATSLGNVIMQLVSTGACSSLAEGRKLIKNSFETQTFEPKDEEDWNEVYAKYKRIEGRL